jgi:hypothetical protein
MTNLIQKNKSKILTALEESQIAAIKVTIGQNINSATPNNILQVACDNFKYAFEEAIKIAGDKGKQSLTTSSHHINLFHEVVKSELVEKGIKNSLIFPPQHNSKGELNLSGFIKAKKQDISAVPNQFLGREKPEPITIGMMTGEIDTFGKDFTENTLVINVRSQMSSIGNNVDTIFERAFAETLNLHMRCPKMVLGELFILPVTGFNMKDVKKKIPTFEAIISTKKKANTTLTANVIEKFINTYSSLNKRDLSKDEAYKYERVCLILADFSKSPVKIYTNEHELKADNLLPKNSTVNLSDISFPNFITDLLTIYETRFGKGKFN